MHELRKIDSEYGIVGGGVAGLAAAIALQKLGKNYLLFEQAELIKGIGAGFGLAANAMQALEVLGLRQEVEKIGYYLDTYNILDEKGNVLVAPDTRAISQKYQKKNFSLHRADLHFHLLSKLPEKTISLGHKVIKLKQFSDHTILTFEDGSTYSCRYLIIADGARSPLRQQIVPSAVPRYSGYTCWRATIDNTSIKLDKGSETWGKVGRFGMTPLVGNRIYWYACVNSSPNNQKYKNYKVADLLRLFEHYHTPIPEILRNTRNEDLLWNDIIDIKPMPKLAYHNILFIGDAGHATTPNMGQGACQALEDVAVLFDELQSKSDIANAFLSFEKRRLARTAYIIETSKRIGEVAQWDNDLLISIRNNFLKLVPTKIAQMKLSKLLAVDFMKIRK